MTQAVLVAGAGPVGLTMAMALKRRDVAVRVIDRAPARTDKSKALVLWPRTLELLETQGCAEAFVQAGMPCRHASIHAGDRELIRLALDTVATRFPFALMLPQSETERLLEEALGRLGLEVERRVELVSFAEKAGSVTAELRHPDGRTETATFAALIGCDGAHSTVRHGLSVQFEGSTEPSDWILADAIIDGPLPPDEMMIVWQPDGILAFFPIIGGRFRVIADTPTAGNEAPPTLAEVQALLDARGPKGLRVHDPVWLSRFTINERKVGEYRRGRVFLAGDAAHIHSPAGGQGMNTGMQDAFNLAWKLALVWHGAASEALLDAYSPERSAIGDQVLHNATQMTHVAILRNPILQQIRNAAAGVLGHLPALRHRMVEQLTELDLHYRPGELTRAMPGAAPHPLAGHRAPDLDVVTEAGTPGRLYPALGAGRFVILAIGQATPELPPDLAALAEPLRASATGDYAAGYIYLIRPDGYVALSTPADGAPAIARFLREFAPATLAGG